VLAGHLVWGLKSSSATGGTAVASTPISESGQAALRAGADRRYRKCPRQSDLSTVANKVKGTGRNSHLNRVIADFYPGYFAFVMATGIVSVATYELGLIRIAWILFPLSIAGYLATWTLTLVRLLRHPQRVAGDFIDHRRGGVFFTVVAASCVLGIQVVMLARGFAIATVLWVVGVVLWFCLTYMFFTAATVRAVKPSLETGISGSWLNIVVATQSVSVLGMLVASRPSAWLIPIQFFSLSMYLLGCMLYLLIITLILYRILFFTMHAREFTPPYWIDMGAEAVTALAGTLVISHVAPASVLYKFVPFVTGFTLFFWVTGTWWLPLLTILTIWRHVWMHYPLEYTPRYWSLVFPLGMYTTCTFNVAREFDLDFLIIISRCMIYLALLAWLVTFIGMIKTLCQGHLGLDSYT
jgi:tellurite resistance protein TehA-like permease